MREIRNIIILKYYAKIRQQQKMRMRENKIYKMYFFYLNFYLLYRMFYVLVI